MVKNWNVVTMGTSNYLKDNKDLMREYDYEKNIDLDLNKITLGSNKKIWWKCNKNHSYEQIIKSKSRGVGCPICTNKKILKGYNDLATTNPELLTEWNYAKNKENGIFPDNIFKGSEIVTCWICPNCKKEYSCYAYSKKEKVGCPYCSGLKRITGYNDIFTIEPFWKESWDYEKNIVNPKNISRMSKKKIWWICSECGKSFCKTPRHIEHIVLCNDCSIKKGINRRIRTLIAKNGNLAEKYPEIAKEWDYEKMLI